MHWYKSEYKRAFVWSIITAIVIISVSSVMTAEAYHVIVPATRFFIVKYVSLVLWSISIFAFGVAGTVAFIDQYELSIHNKEHKGEVVQDRV